MKEQVSGRQRFQFALGSLLDRPDARTETDDGNGEDARGKDSNWNALHDRSRSLAAAIVQRDAGADGQFVYAVRSTGVFCHPSCASRPAKRENIRFYATPDDATASGYRPCKRCRPGKTSRGAELADAIARTCALVTTAETPPTLEEMAASAGLSPYHFHRLFNAQMALTPKACVKSQQTRRMRDSLTQATSITSAIFGAGHSSSSRFYETATGRLGMNARSLKSGGIGAHIKFAVSQCSLGSILVGATEKGIRAIEFGDEPEALVHRLENRLPKANLIGADRAFEQHAAEVVRAVATPELARTLPLDVQGTAFHGRVCIERKRALLDRETV